MSLYSFFQWLASTRISDAMNASVWAFAAVETLHLLSLALLGGMVLMLNLRLLGLRLQRRPPAEVAQELYPYTRASLAVMLASGVMLLIDGPLRYYGNKAFRLKMVLLAAAIMFSYLQHRRIVRFGLAPIRPIERAGAAVALSLWLGVGLAGRAIGFL